MKTCSTIVILVAILISTSYGQKHLEVLEKTSSEHVTSTYLNTNNISTIIYNDGRCDVLGGQSAFEFPRGSGNYAVYQSGFLWGAFIEEDTLVKVGGSAFWSTIKPGKILPDGTQEDPALPKNRIYRVRPDVYPGGPYANLLQEMRDEKDTYENIRSRYEDDWNEWPAPDGAPFVDKDLNGVYDPSIDLPGIKSSSLTIWYVANDLSESDSTFSYEINRLGIELQVTMWAYQNEPVFSNVIFRKYKLINKSQDEFRDMYISVWSDPDVGGAGDDYVGTDTLRNMVYAYNSDDLDDDYGSTPPSVGFQLLQGPIVAGNAGEDRNKNGIDDASDFAIYDNSLRGPGFINLPMTSSYHPEKNNSPSLFQTEDSKQWYQYFQGINGNYGTPFIDPNSGEETVYPLSGDPITQTGWIDGQIFQAGDRRTGFSSGSFNLTSGDSQEVVVAVSAEMGSDRLESIKLLRFYADEIQNLYKNSNFPENLPALPSPDVKITNSIDGILLDWSSNNASVSAIENYNSAGYKFQGYNVYQGMVSESGLAFYSKAAVFDIIDGVTTIYGEFRDSITGLPTQGIKQQGTDNGIERSIFFDKDNEFDSPLLKGKDYSFGVSAYTYNENPPNGISTTETPIHYFNVTYLDTLPGANHGDPISYLHSAGSGQSDKIEISVADPSKLTGDDYEIFFTTVNYFRDVDGEWYPLAKVGDLTGSRLEARATYGDIANTIDTEFELFINSPNDAWIDGIVISFPIGTIINSAPEFQAGGGTVTPEINDRQIMLGLVNNQRTQDGIFHGGEKWNVIIQNTTLPINLEYILKDDGWENNPVDVTDSIAISEISFASKTEKHWNLRNITKNDTVLMNQNAIMGYNLYTGEYVGDPIIEGLKISLDVNYALTTYSSAKLTTNADPSDGDLTFWGDLTLFGDDTGFWYEEGSTVTVPTVDQAQPDLEFRFTGVAASNDDVVTAGGQWTTQWERAGFGANDMTGLNSVQIRAPFELWDIENNIQLEFVTINRNADGASPYGNDVGAPDVARWRITGRDYIVILYKPYTDDANLRRDLNDETATWCVFFDQGGTAVWSTGDVFTITYANPIREDDKFTFTAPQRFNKEDFRIPESFELYHNYPNPFNPTTTIRFDLPEDNIVKLEVFNILGQRVRSLINNEFYEGGTYDVQFNGRGLSSGVYFYRIEFGSYFDVKKMLLVK